MTEFEKTKYQAITVLQNLCVRCKEGIEHVCPVRQITKRIEEINGVPVIVNSKLWHVIFHLTPALSDIGEGERVR